MIHDTRIHDLNSKEVQSGSYLIYWMQQSQRVNYNHALEFTIREANKLVLPVIVYFELIDDYPEANLRHYQFMLEGLQELQDSLKNMGIKLIVKLSRDNDSPALDGLSKDAVMVVTDIGYTRFQRKWRGEYSKKVSCRLIGIESDLVVPVSTVSNKEEYSAATLRRKITPLLDEYLVPMKQTAVNISSLDMNFKSMDFSNINIVLDNLKIDKSVGPVEEFVGGESKAIAKLNNFITDKLKYYSDKRNDPNSNVLSDLSPYLHFGQISALQIAINIKFFDSVNAAAYLEELIVRRELAINFVYFNKNYDKYESLHDWAKNSLNEHKSDERDYIYSRDDFENARTHDPYWNAAQNEMRVTGKMHGYMRMYWGKKIIEWTSSPEEAWDIMLYLNNKYELDGRDPNGFAGVAWCFGKHDRPWAERPVFGKIRYMNAAGLKRKFNADAYVNRINEISKA